MIVFQIPAQMFYQLHQSKIFNRTTSVTETQKHQCTMGFAMHIQEKKKMPLTTCLKQISGMAKQLFYCWSNISPIMSLGNCSPSSPYGSTSSDSSREDKTRMLRNQKDILVTSNNHHIFSFSSEFVPFLFEYVCPAISDIVLSYGFQFSSCISFILSYECTNLNNQ